jgi:hypothetical protein
VIKKNTSQCLRLAPFSATSDSSTTSEFWMNSGDEIRGEAATTRSHTRGHESIQLSIFNPDEENARTGSPTMKERKRCTALGRVRDSTPGVALSCWRGLGMVQKVEDFGQEMVEFYYRTTLFFLRRIDFGIRFEMESECTVSPVLFPRISYDSVV